MTGDKLPSARRIAGQAVALAYKLLFPGKVHGNNFIIRRPILVRVRKGGELTLGQGVMIEPGARIVVHAKLSIGHGVYIGKNSTLIAFEDLTIGDRTLIGENVSIHTEDHGPAGRRNEFLSSPISIGADAWVGAGTVVLRGTTIGAASTVAANSVVRSDIPDAVLAAGAPATVKRKLPWNG